MHSLLAHLYHAARSVLEHIAALPFLRACLAALVVAALGRLARPRLAAGFAVLMGWAVLTWPFLLEWPLPPVARLAGAAVLLAGFGFMDRAPLVQQARGRKGAKRPPPAARVRWWARPLVCLLLAWWLRGAPFDGNGILNGMPLFLGLLAGWAVARRLARGDAGWAVFAAAAALAGSLLVAGVSPHWVWLALVPCAAGLALAGVADAVPALVAALVVLAGAAIVASNRGRFVPADAACLMPLLALALAPRLVPRKPAAGALLAAGICIALTWAARSALAGMR